MFGTLANFATGLTKVAVGVVVAPVALVADVVSLPATADDLHRGPFDNTAAALNLVGKGLKDSVKGE